jgi:plasmid stability protein
MAQLLVRNVDEQLVRGLKIRAAQKGISAEAEHREILRTALAPHRDRGSLKERLITMPDVGTDEDFVFDRDLDRRD